MGIPLKNALSLGLAICPDFGCQNSDVFPNAQGLQNHLPYQSLDHLHYEVKQHDSMSSGLEGSHYSDSDSCIYYFDHPWKSNKKGWKIPKFGGWKMSRLMRADAMEGWLTVGPVRCSEFWQHSFIHSFRHSWKSDGWTEISQQEVGN